MKSSINTSKENNKENESTKPNPVIDNIKSRYILSKIYDNMTIKKKLEIVKHNKKIQNRINLSVNDYKEYCEIEIEIIPIKDKFGKFINIDENDKLFYHIYFNDNEEEIENKYKINYKDKVTKIKIIIDYQVKSFKELFYDCECIESINFKKFYRNNITDMSWMFYECLYLKELNLNNFNTNNVTNMNCMFYRCLYLKELNLNNFNTNNVTDMNHMFDGCSSLKELNLNNFNTNNVTDMRGMFSRCSSLKELNLNNFNTNNVTNMSRMFNGCSSLKELNLNNFNTNNVTNMREMFFYCSSLKELNLINFNTNNVIDMIEMFRGCSDDLRRKIKSENKNIKDEAFNDYD